MRSRGRPKTVDILTPREWEVLALIREGLSNREIADRLGFSLAGAKFHVSEIISKLGVTTREEAASWRPERTQYAMGPLAHAWRLLRPTVRSSPLAVRALPPLIALIGLTVAAFQIAENAGTRDRPSSDPALQAEGVEALETAGREVSISGTIFESRGSLLILDNGRRRERFLVGNQMLVSGTAGWRVLGSESLHMLKAGDSLVVSGTRQNDGSILAEQIVVTGFTRSGGIEAVGADYVDVRVRNGPLNRDHDATSTRFRVEAQTSIWSVTRPTVPGLASSASISLGDLSVGGDVNIQGAFAQDGTPVATLVLVFN